MRFVVFCATLAAAIPPSIARAQSLALTESEVLARVSVESPRVRAMRAGIDVARADVMAAGRWPNPRATFARESVAGIPEHRVMIAQPLPITARRGLEVDAATATVAAASSRSDEEIRRL